MSLDCAKDDLEVTVELFNTVSPAFDLSEAFELLLGSGAESLLSDSTELDLLCKGRGLFCGEVSRFTGELEALMLWELRCKGSSMGNGDIARLLITP